MDLEKLVEFLVKSIVRDESAVSVRSYEDEEVQTIEVMVAKDDMGLVIGKEGKIASSIRTIVKSAAYVNGLKKVNINFDAF